MEPTSIAGDLALGVKKGQVSEVHKDNSPLLVENVTFGKDDGSCVGQYGDESCRQDREEHERTILGHPQLSAIGRRLTSSGNLHPTGRQTSSWDGLNCQYSSYDNNGCQAADSFLCQTTESVLRRDLDTDHSSLVSTSPQRRPAAADGILPHTSNGQQAHVNSAQFSMMRVSVEEFRTIQQHPLALNLMYQLDLVGAACTEENELLNVTSIKMSDAPFNRSESEDDIVEEYDDVVSFKTPCLRSRTPLEKLLLVLLVLFLVVIIGMAVGLTRPQIVPVTKYCKSSACVQAASSVLSTIDWSVNPCDDFYKFACGHWLKTQPIPRGYRHWDRIQELSGHNLYVLSNLIDSSPQTGEGFRKTRTFYQSCMASGPDKRSELLDKFRAVIDDNGGWSLSQNDTFDDWSFMIGLENVHRQGSWPFFKLSVEVDEREPTQQNIIKIDVGDTILPSDLLPIINSSHGNSSDSSNNNNNSSMPNSLKDALQLKKIFLEETMHLFTSFGATEADALTRAEKILEIEKFVSSASAGYHHIHDKFSLYNVMTVAELEYNFTMVNWVQHLNALGFRVDGETEVVVLHPDYMAKITGFLKEYYSGTEANMRTMRDYLTVHLIRSFKPFFDQSLFEIKETEEDEMEEAWKRCTFYTNRALGFATGALYVKGTDSEGSVEKMEKLIIYVKNAFKDYLLNKYWMDKKTMKKAEEKVDAIIDKISYPSYILNDSFLDEYYKNFNVIPNDWLYNLLSWRRFLLANMNFDLQAVPDRKSSWMKPPVTVNAYYSPTRNDVIFPIAMFHLPFYIPDGPSAVNFGAMGSIIGHEITHAFDFQGRQYDGQGKLTDWWDEQTAQNFMLTTPCMKNQYSRMKVRGVKIDGDFTLDENIADNSGLRAAVYAYQMWVEEFGEELQLPGLNMSMYQIFYTSFAQMYCSKWTDAGLFYHLLTDPHSPGSARVNGALSNSQTFSWAFQCPLDSPMNPRTKCEVW